MKYNIVLSVMRKLFFVAVVFSMLLSASPAAAAPPIREAVPIGPINFTGICSFDVIFEPVFGELYVTTFTDGDGNVTMMLLTGVNIGTLTNLSTGYTITVNVSGPQKITLNPDGSGQNEIIGPWLLSGPYPGSLELPDLALLTGHGLFAWDSNGNITEAFFDGKVTDVCEALGG